MMECSDCKSWIHAHCEGLSDEKYQVLSNLPSTIEFVCRDCCKDPPALWSVAVNAELKAGYLNVIRALIKNRNICSYLKSSPRKMVCACQDANRKPIHLKNLSGQSDILLQNNKNISGSPLTITDEKNSDLGLLTPKLTKDDEESLQTVKSGFLNLVSCKDGEEQKQITIYSLSNEIENKTVDIENTYNRNNAQLLSIACNTSELNCETRDNKKNSNYHNEKDENIGTEGTDDADNSCNCMADVNNSSQPLSLMIIKNKALNDDYSSTLEFNRDVEKVIKEIQRPDILKIYYKALRQIFPWFDPRDSTKNESSVPDFEPYSENKLRECRKSIEEGETEYSCKNEVNNSVEGLLNHEQNYYYIGFDIIDDRTCMLCKLMGEGKPNQEGRLLYCGQSEWVHVNCALWSSEVFEEIDGSLQNVHSAISRARLIRCFGCDKKGASVGCCAKSCPSAYHFGCAISANCVFLENKEVFCKMHKNMSSAKEVHREEDFSISRSVYVELDHKKKKDVFKNQVQLFLGSLSIINVGEIIPELSDMVDVLLPCEFHCSRLYWSSKEPWKLVRYYVKTKVTNSCREQVIESETNYTIDHSLEFTPPPSPIDAMYQVSGAQHTVDEKDIKLLVNQIIDTICTKEEENIISEPTTTDLLPPELKDAIFEDLPHDLLDGISMHDIFTKMNFDDILSEVKHESVYGESSHVDNVKKTFSEEQKRSELINKNKLLKNNAVKTNKNIVKSHNFFRDRKATNSSIKTEQFLNKVKDRNWKAYKLLQVDGALDLSESDQSDDSCDMMSNTNSTINQSSVSLMEDNPVKCSRCHRTYRSNVGYERHLSTCNYLSSSDSESSEEERDKPSNDLLENNSYFAQPNMNCANVVSSSSVQALVNGNIVNHISTDVSTMTLDATSSVCPIEQTSVCSVEQTVSTNCSLSINGGTQLPNNMSNINMNHVDRGIPINPFKADKLSLSIQEVNEHVPLNTRPYGNYINHAAEQQSVVEIENTIASSAPPTIILQQVPTENVIPTFIPSYSQNSQQNIQYITSVDNQDKYIASSQLTPGTYHIQTAQPIQQPVVQNVPTVVGTIIQHNGVDQIVLNGPNQPIEMYTPPQNNVYITSTPMIVGMETVVSNTVMSSSQFISGSVPGMLAASSYSATTTQVFQATKPVIDIPQSYVVVNTNPPIIENNTCVQPNIIQNSITPWNNLISCQDPYKLSKNVSYQTVTRQIIHEQKEIDGIKMINSTQETIVIEPMPANSRDSHVEEIRKVEPTLINNQPPPMPTPPPPPPPPPLPPALPPPLPPHSSFQRVLQNVKQSVATKTNNVKIVELPKSSSVCKEKPQQAVAPVVVKKVLENGLKTVNFCQKSVFKKTETISNDLPCKNNTVEPTLENIETIPPPPAFNPSPKPPESKQIDIIPKEEKKITNVINNLPPAPKVTKINSVKSSVKSKRENPNIRKIIQEEPKITYEITSDDGFSYCTNDLKIAWETVFEKVQKAREAKGLPPLTENPFSSPSTMLKKMMGLGNNSVKYVLEQLPGASGCSKYKPVYHQKKLSALEKELSKDLKGNSSGCARTEKFHHTPHKYDMFSWLASRHRRPPKLLAPDNDCINGSRRTNMNLPMAMRFRHLKETSNAVGVFRSDIHGRGLFCLRDIDSGEMVIEYAGEVIRSALTDKRERYYTAKGIGCYMFRIDDKFVVDATMKGNAARFINHSCEPNCYSKVVDILGKKHILIFAMRRILQGEELTYDYKFPLEEEKINCHCLSRRCRKYLN